MKKCKLDVSVNKCEFFVTVSCECQNTNKCSFQEVEPEDVEDVTVGNNGYVRKERWYEKYYRNSRPKRS